MVKGRQARDCSPYPERVAKLSILGWVGESSRIAGGASLSHPWSGMVVVCIAFPKLGWVIGVRTTDHAAIAGQRPSS